MRRTMLIPREPEDIYKKAFQWMSIQGYEIEEQVHNQKITVTSGASGGNPLVAGAMQLLGGAWRMTLVLEPTDDGTFVVGDLKGAGANKAYSQLVGVLSLMGAKE